MKPQPSCAGRGPGSVPWGNVTALEECCLATPGCAGFNTHNVLKASGCGSAISKADCDLYLKKDTPQPPPPPPYPAPPSQRQSVGLWPLPRNFTNGDIAVSLAADFAITIAEGSTPTLKTTVSRYNRLVLIHGPPTSAAASTASAGARASPLLHGCAVYVSNTTEEVLFAVLE